MGTLNRLADTHLAESVVGAALGALLARGSVAAYKRVAGRPGHADNPMYLRNAARASWLVGALAGGANPWLRSGDFSGGGARLWKSMLESKTGMVPHQNAAPSYSPFAGTVDTGMARDIVNSDLFLQPTERRGILGVMGRAPELPSGRTSQFGLTQAALRAGVAFVPAYTFGEIAAKAFGASPDTAKAISRVGALAYALRSSGILEYM